MLHVTIRGFDLEIDGSRIAEPREEVRAQAREYDSGERTAFDLDVAYPDDFTGRVMVVGANSLGGFSAEGGVALKRALLAHENPDSASVQSDLEAYR